VSNGASEHLTALPELRQKITGRADLLPDMLTLSSHTSTPQPEPHENPVHTTDAASRPTMLTPNDA
jgi:hypothetical protein